MTIDIPAQYGDTSAWSYHVDDAFYAEVDRFNTLLRADWPEADHAQLASAQSFLNREARLIDEHRFEEWLTLFSADCLYWVPVDPEERDPKTAVSHAFDDFRRLTDRVFWHGTGLAFSQIPPSRTRRLITNLETMTDPVSGARLVRSNFAVYEFRVGVSKVYPGWYGHVLDGEQIRLKQVNLLESDQLHDNLTLIF